MRIMAIAPMLLTKFFFASGGWTDVVDHNEKGVLRIGHAHDTMITSRLLCTTALPRGPPGSNRFDQADIRDLHLFDFQLVASDCTDCLFALHRLSSISNQKAGHNTCHLQVHQKLMLVPHFSSRDVVDKT